MQTEKRKKRKPKQFSDKSHETQLKDITAIWPDIQEILIKHRYLDSTNQAAVVRHFERKALGKKEKHDLSIAEVYSRLAADKKKIIYHILAGSVEREKLDGFPIPL